RRSTKSSKRRLLSDGRRSTWLSWNCSSWDRLQKRRRSFIARTKVSYREASTRSKRRGAKRRPISPVSPWMSNTGKGNERTRKNGFLRTRRQDLVDLLGFADDRVCQGDATG